MTRQSSGLRITPRGSNFGARPKDGTSFTIVASSRSVGVGELAGGAGSVLPFAGVGAAASAGPAASGGATGAAEVSAFGGEAPAPPSMLSDGFSFASEPSVGSDAAPEVSVVGVGASSALLVEPDASVARVSDAAPAVSDPALSDAGTEVSDPAPEVSDVGVEESAVGSEFSDVAPSEAGGGGGSARAVATNAEAQRNAAAKAADHARIPGDRRLSERDNGMLRTTTQLLSSARASARCFGSPSIPFYTPDASP
jgi:hypothetical protein